MDKIVMTQFFELIKTVVDKYMKKTVRCSDWDLYRNRRNGWAASSPNVHDIRQYGKKSGSRR